jgi:O-antigen/teichoic acid export membrane protein
MSSTSSGGTSDTGAESQAEAAAGGVGEPAQESAPTSANESVHSVRRRALSGTLVLLGGFGAGQILRLGSNLVLSRLLFPAAFGLMAIVNLFMQGLTMFSDIGIAPAIVQHKDGLKESFLNTAWTVQIVRGFVLWLCLCILAVPVAHFYGEPELRLLLPCVGLNAAIMGFRSTAGASLNRQLKLGSFTFTDLASQVVTTVVMIVVALVRPTVWSLVIGGLVGSVAAVILSHVALPGIRHRLNWDPAVRQQLFKFGRWITLSSAFTFLASQGDRAILSTFVSMGTIGIYSVAANLSQVMLNVVSRLSGSVLFPVYASWSRQGPEVLRKELYHVRVKTQWWLFLPPAGVAVLGEPIIHILYDKRYHEAGWMLPLMCIAVLVNSLVITIDPILLATGDSFKHMVATISRGLIMIATMAVGGHLGGIEGLLIGSIVGRLIQYPALMVLVRGKGVWMPSLDVLALGASAAFIVAGRWLAAMAFPWAYAH